MKGHGIGFTKIAELMSQDYLRTQVALHADPRGYGSKGYKWADAVETLIHRFNAGSVLDYGCGEGTLVAALRLRPTLAHVRFAEFDPAIPEKNGMHATGHMAHTSTPYLDFADLVVSTDVLEHVEPRYLEATLDRIKGLARKAVFLVIATRPSGKTLTDGRNAHLILESAEWWQATMEAAGFTVQPDPPVSPLAKPSREWVAVLTT